GIHDGHDDLGAPRREGNRGARASGPRVGIPSASRPRGAGRRAHERSVAAGWRSGHLARTVRRQHDRERTGGTAPLARDKETGAMSVVMLGLGMMLVASPWWLSPLSRSLHPRERMRLSVAGLVLGVALVEFALILLAVPTMLSAFGVESLATACRRLLGHLAPGGLQVGWSAASLAV